MLALVLGMGVVAKAAECTPDLTTRTPTPTLNWTQVDHSNTAGFKVYWKRAEDTLWRGSIKLPAWLGDSNSAPVWPGITEPWPLQRLVPVTEQRLLIDVMVVSYSASNVESAPSSILRICMPQIWTGGPYY